MASPIIDDPIIEDPGIEDADVEGRAGHGPGVATRDDRVRGAIWGQLVGDAAALGSHWIYDLDELARAYPEGITGFEPPRAGHYHEGRRPGDQTHYGDGALVLLRSITDAGGFDAGAFGGRFVETFDRATYGGYLDHATLGTLDNYDAFRRDHPGEPFAFQACAADDQPATLTRLSVLVGRYAGSSRAALLDRVRALTLVTQDHPLSLAYAVFSAVLLDGLLEGRGIEPSIAEAQEALAEAAPAQAGPIGEQVRQARAAAGGDVTEATLVFGQSCPLVHSVPAALQVLLTYPDDFEQAILSTVRAGGDSAARAAIVGGWLGAHLGLAGIPPAWIRRLSAGPEISARLDTLLADHHRL